MRPSSPGAVPGCASFPEVFGAFMTTSNASASRSSVVVIDSGWSSAWKGEQIAYQYDFYDDDGNAESREANTHGSFVTGIIRELAPDVDIINLKVFSDYGGTTNIEVIERALDWVIENAAAYRVVAVNLSLGAGAATAVTPTRISDEFASLAEMKILAAVAAGNNGSGAADSVSVIASDPNVICVSASTGSGELAGWSQRHPDLTDLCADGTGVPVTNLYGVTYSVSGTSFSTPQVTAAIALAQDAAERLRGTRLSLGEFITLSQDTGFSIGGTGYYDLNIKGLLETLAATYGSPSVPAPPPVPPSDGAADGAADPPVDRVPEPPPAPEPPPEAPAEPPAEPPPAPAPPPASDPPPAPIEDPPVPARLFQGSDGDDVIDSDTPGNDTLLGLGGLDRLTASLGDDLLDGGDGHDTLAGGEGNNTIWGAGGNDLISAAGGHDLILAGEGNDTVESGSGNDTILAGRQADLVLAGGGDDSVSGGMGFDSLLGGPGNDTLEGGLGNDTLLAGQDNDLVLAGRGDDLLRGGLGNDTLNGAIGNDTIEGNGGDDLLLGAGGADLFVVTSASGADTIGDFAVSEGDRILVADGAAYTITDTAAGALVAFPGGGSILLERLTSRDVTPAIFITD